MCTEREREILCRFNDSSNLFISLAELDTAYQAYFPELCYLYGKRLQQKMGYPIGLVAMTFSDSIIEEWAPHHTLRDCGLSPRDRFVSSLWYMVQLTKYISGISGLVVIFIC